MLLIMMAAICVMLTIILKTRARDSAQLIEPRPSILTIGVQIICGDCSGDDPRPIKTHLGRGGNCAQCGGRSYMLASRRTAAANLIFERPQQELPITNRARPLVASAGPRTIVPVPSSNPWIASSKLLNEDVHQRAS